jgi:hypothetical protein
LKLNEVVHMTFTGVLAEYLEVIAPGVLGDFVTMEGEKEVIYLLLTSALYGYVPLARLWAYPESLQFVGSKLDD